MLTDPEPLELGQDVQRLEHFQVEHLHIRKPELQQKAGKVKDLEKMTSDVNLRCQEKHRLKQEWLTQGKNCSNKSAYASEN